MDSFDWRCPYCERSQTVTGANFHTDYQWLPIGPTADGLMTIDYKAIRCANPACLKMTISVSIQSAARIPVTGGVTFGKPVFQKQIMPDSSARNFPDYIPKPLLDDYREACLIRDLSPKAACTLARRCIQGMIRDFCGISERTLFAEIQTLKDQVDEGRAPPGVTIETVLAMDSVRSVGNIGAHMEADINVVVDVDSTEAAALISLIEMLFEDWYVARHSRQQRFAEVARIAANKSEARAAPQPGVHPASEDEARSSAE